MTRITPFLMFEGRAEEAIRFYVSLFKDAEIELLERYGPEEPEREGMVVQAVIRLWQQRIMLIDSPPVHDFGFTPAISLFVDVGNEAEVRRLFGALSDGGKVLMPLTSYPFSPLFGWVEDRFGVSWQIRLESA